MYKPYIYSEWFQSIRKCLVISYNSVIVRVSVVVDYIQIFWVVNSQCFCWNYSYILLLLWENSQLLLICLFHLILTLCLLSKDRGLEYCWQFSCTALSYLRYIFSFMQKRRKNDDNDNNILVKVLIFNLKFADTFFYCWVFQIFVYGEISVNILSVLVRD